MELIKFLFENSSKKLLIFAVITGVVNGIAATLLLWNINSAISGKQEPYIFIALLLGSVVTFLLSTYLIVWLSQDNLYSLRKRIVSMILDAEYREIELHGKAKLYTLLTQDIGALVNAVSFIPSIIIDTSILLSCLLYILFLSPHVFLMLLFTLVLGLAVYFIINKPTYALIDKNRTHFDTLFQYYNGIIYGNREYKHDIQIKNKNYENDFIESLDEIKKTNLKAQLLFSLGEVWGRLVIFILLGAIAYFVPANFSALEIPRDVIATTVIVIIFSLGPIYTLVDIFPLLSRTSIAYKRVQSINIKKEEKEEKNDGLSLLCDEIRYDNIEYTYSDIDHKKMFHIGPVSLKIKRGEIVFIAGGNGSGKTSLLKILTGIYPVDNGSISCGTQKITRERRNEFRKLFSVLWNDCYLFERMFEQLALTQKKELDHWLDKLDIRHKVNFTKEGKVNHDTLSSGQKKRLALISALFQNNDYLVLDEWAAEQSPDYKEIFYREILPELKLKGTGILIISHDSDYFDAADRIFTMNDGQLKDYSGSI